MRNRRMRLQFPTGGVVKRTAYQKQPPYTAYSASNVWPDNVVDGRERGGVRPGLSVAVTGTLPGPIRMLHEINLQTETGTESVLVCSAGGNFYRRLANGSWGSAVSTSYTLATDRLIQAAVFGQKLYIADYGIVDSGLDLQVSASSNVVVHLPTVESGTDGVLDAAGLVFTSAGSTFVTEGVTAGVHVLRLTDTGDTAAAVVGVYEIASVDSETQLTLAATAGTTETGVDFVVRPSLSNVGVTVDDHGLEVLDAGNGTAGFYTINSISEDQVTLATSPGTTSTTGIHYRFHRTPKVWDLVTDTISKWTTTFGTLPLSCNVICYFQDRIVLAGAPSEPNVWFASRQGDPHDFLYAQDDAQTAVAGNNFANGQIGDPITALIPHNRQCLVIGAEDSLYVLRGDPASPSATIDQLSAHLGPISPQAWCKDEKFHTWMLTRDGLYRMASGCGDTPESFSRERLPEALLNLPTDGYIPMLQYDLNIKAVVIYIAIRTVGVYATDWESTDENPDQWTSASFASFDKYQVRAGDYLRIIAHPFYTGEPFYLPILSVDGDTITVDDEDGFGGAFIGVECDIVPFVGAANLCYWVDTQRGGIWPMEYDGTLFPTAVREYPAITSATLSPVVLGGSDGVCRQHDREAGTDSGTTFTGSVAIGPFPLSSDSMTRALVRSAKITTTQEASNLQWTIRVGNTAENVARQATPTPQIGNPNPEARNKNIEHPCASRSYSAPNYNGVQHPRLSGQSGLVELSGSGSSNWGLESIDLEIAEGGMLR